ncbi:MAG: hypothetical protein HKN75_07750 [Bacteroidia bacterium]|nr:hypothetical protein [Bacteroidia bacterium]
MAGFGSMAEMIRSNKANQSKLRKRGMFGERKSFHDLRQEAGNTEKGTFEYNEETTSKIIENRKRAKHKKESSLIKTYVSMFLLSLALLAFLYFFVV